jgi:predicted amidophosphoribosyltransferase
MSENFWTNDNFLDDDEMICSCGCEYSMENYAECPECGKPHDNPFWDRIREAE